MTDREAPRQPRAFRPDDPKLRKAEEIAPAEMPVASDEAIEREYRIPTGAEMAKGFRWGALFLSAMAGLTSLALGLWFARFASVALQRQDWVGWVAFGFLMVAILAMAAMVAREIVGLVRLDRVYRIKQDADRALSDRDGKLARSVTKRLRGVFAGRRTLATGQARLIEHEGDIMSAAELLKLADRELVARLDGEARRIVVGSAKRVSMVTALSPVATLTVGYVVIENLRMLRRLAALYGGRPGLIGLARLARMVVTHIIVTGGIALTDDLLHQFLGQDLVRRLSRRLGEGVFNGTLTARVGTAAIAVIRPLPFLDSEAPRLRDMVGELLKRDKIAAQVG
jgi:putative membrane protein